MRRTDERMRQKQNVTYMKPAVVEGIVEAAVLLVLSERESYGYELANALAQSRLVPQKIQSARVYEVLRRLEANGAVASGKEVSPAGPDRRSYTLTLLGQGRLQGWAQALRLTANSLSTFLATYTISQRERGGMGCQGCRGGQKCAGCQGCGCSCCPWRNTSPSSPDDLAQIEQEQQARKERIAQLERELAALKSLDHPLDVERDPHHHRPGSSHLSFPSDDSQEHLASIQRGEDMLTQ